MVFVTYSSNKVEFLLNSKSYFELFSYVYNYLKLHDPFIEQNNFNLIYNKNGIDYIIDNNYEINENNYVVVLKPTRNKIKYYYNDDPYKFNIYNFMIDNDVNKLIESLCEYHKIVNGKYEISISNSSITYYKSYIKITTTEYNNSYSCYDSETITNINYNIYNNEINNLNNQIDFDNIVFVLNIIKIN